MAIDQAKPDPSAEWWTTSEVAAYLGLRVATVSSYRMRGQMPQPDMTLGRTHVWRPSKIINWQKAPPRPGVGGRPVADSGTASVGEDDDPTELTPARAEVVLQKACAAAGLDPDGARLLRVGSNAVFRLTAPVVARISRSGASVDQARRAVAVARWLESVDYPAVRAVDVDLSRSKTGFGR